jgi:putative ABC transport system permease protein
MFTDDLRHSLRRLRARPATVVAAAAMLALGVGLTTAMFTIADTLILRPLPFRDPDRLAQVYMGSSRGGRIAVSVAVFRAWRNLRAFEAVESVSTGTALIATDSGPIARASATVTPGLFTMLDVRPVRGRLFDAGEGRAGADDRILLSEDVWRATFGADPALVGRSILVDGRPSVVVGILPSDFRFPRWNTVVWRPIDFDVPPPGPGSERPIAYVRFAAGVPQADALRLATDAAHGVDGSTSTLFARPVSIAQRVQDQYYQRAVPLLVGGVALMFLVLCANVSSLLLVRLTDRRHEFSMCSALGASRGRLMGQAFLESAMLGAAGAVGGLALGWLLVAAARGFLPEAFLLRTLNPLNLDPRALAAASISGVAATILAGVLPAWIGTRLDPAGSLRLADRGGTDTRGARSLSRALIVGEIALACTLLVGATLLVRSFVNLSRADRGFDPRGIVYATINLPTAAFKDAASRRVIRAAIEEELRRLPGAQQVALSYGIPPDGSATHYGFKLQSDVAGAQPFEIAIVESYTVGADFFDLYRIPLVRGRSFNAGDAGQRVVVLGERLASRLWPGEDPAGRSFTFGKEQYQVVGVAREIHHPSVDARIDRPELYHPISSAGLGGYFTASIRCGATCPDGAIVRERMRATNPAIDITEVGPLEAAYMEQLAPPRAAAALGFVFAAVAVLAAAGGLFGVLSHAVNRRRREFGIRTALGATGTQIQRLVLRDGAIVAAIGIAIGAAAGRSLATGLGSLQYGVSVSDPVSWLVVIGLLAITTLVAAWRPARKAATIDPVRLLREE